VIEGGLKSPEVENWREVVQDRDRRRKLLESSHASERKR